jgi:hypothetical protein
MFIVGGLPALLVAYYFNKITSLKSGRTPAKPGAKPPWAALRQAFSPNMPPHHFEFHLHVHHQRTLGRPTAHGHHLSRRSRDAP